MSTIKALIIFLVIFVSSSQGLIYFCDFIIEDWYYPGNLYTCKVTKSELTGNDNAVDEVRGTHMEDKANKNVLGLNVVYPRYNRIPSNIGNIFPSLLALQFNTGDIKYLTADDLKQFPNLRSLDLASCRLAVLDGDVFKHTPNIQFLNLAYNLITNVGSDLLNSLEDLTYATFQVNVCIDLYASSPGAMQNLKTQLAQKCPAR